MVVESWLRRAARSRPDHVALRAEDGALTYAELDAAATLAAQRLSALGARAGPAARSSRRCTAACAWASSPCRSTCA
jgi:non-ribosomal peptide synthetase component E (peptide arylation enzyme)